MDNDTVVKTETGIKNTPAVQPNRLSNLPEPNPDNFDKEAFTEIVRKMKGNSSAREFSLATELSESFITKAVTGFIERPPAKRTMLKLLCVSGITPADRREMARAAGYPVEKIDWENRGWENEERQTVSAAEAINRVYGGNHYLAMGRLMSSLAQHGVDGDMSSHMFREDGYFEIKDEVTGQVYVGINSYCSASGDKDNAAWAMVFSLALTYQKICTSENVGEKVVYIMTNQEAIFDSCQTFGFNSVTKATVVVLTDDFKGFRAEKVLHGNPLISLLDEIPE